MTIDFDQLSDAVGTPAKHLFVCVVCNCSYDRVSDLTSHLKIHGVTTPAESHVKTYVTNTTDDVTCRVCGKIFTSQSALDFHTQQMHGETRCPFCSIQLRSAFELLSHMKWHSTLSYEHSTNTPRHNTSASDVTNECRVCGRSGFLSSEELQLHMREMHAPAYKRACFMCGKKLGSQEEVVTHFQVEHPSQYSQMISASRNNYISRGAAQNFPCKICPVNFADQESLSMHEDTVHKGLGLSPKKARAASRSDLTCSRCNATFASSFAFLRHNEVVHGTLDAHFGSEQATSLQQMDASVTSDASSCRLHVVSPSGLHIEGDDVMTFIKQEAKEGLQQNGEVTKNNFSVGDENSRESAKGTGEICNTRYS